MEQPSAVKYVYLAGPITGLNNQTAGDWREQVRGKLHSDIRCLSPLRDTADYSPVAIKSRDQTSLHSDLLHGMSIVARDRMDVLKCDLILVNVLHSKALSLGTIGEIFWADAFRKPVIIVKEEASLYNHAMLDAICQWKFDNLNQAVTKINVLLSDFQS